MTQLSQFVAQAASDSAYILDFTVGDWIVTGGGSAVIAINGVAHGKGDSPSVELFEKVATNHFPRSQEATQITETSGDVVVVVTDGTQFAGRLVIRN